MTTALETVSDEIFFIEPQLSVSSPILTGNVDTTDAYVLVFTVTDTVTTETLRVHSTFPTATPVVDGCQTSCISYI